MNDPLFRPEAVEEHVGAQTRDRLLRISPRWEAWAFWLLIATIAGGVAFVALVHVDRWITGPALVVSADRVSPESPSEAGLPAETLVFLPAATADLRIGQPVRVHFTGGNVVLELTIDRIEPEAITPARARERLGPVVSGLDATTPLIVVHAALPAGGRGRIAHLMPGTIGTASVRVGRETLWTALEPGQGS